MADLLPGTQTDHPAHDTILVAALAAGDLADLARADAEALVAACPDCAALHADLLAIASATRSLPAPARPRDFRLTPEQAESLRPSGLRRLVAAFGSPRLAVTRPLAVTFTTLGVVGLLLTAIPAAGPAALFPGAAERQVLTPSAANDDGAARPDESAVPVFGAGSAPLPASSPAPEGGLSGAPPASSPDAAAGGESKDTTPARSADLARTEGGPPWLAILSVALLAAGLGLFVARAAARRIDAA